MSGPSRELLLRTTVDLTEGISAVDFYDTWNAAESFDDFLSGLSNDAQRQLVAVSQVYKWGVYSGLRTALVALGANAFLVAVEGAREMGADDLAALAEEAMAFMKNDDGDWSYLEDEFASRAGFSPHRFVIERSRDLDVIDDRQPSAPSKRS